MTAIVTGMFAFIAVSLLRNDAIDSGERGRLARGFRRPAENLHATYQRTIGCLVQRTQAVGETPTEATETVALPFEIASFRFGPSRPNSKRLQFVACLPRPIL